MNGAPDPVYVRARRVLLDALEALKEHHKAVLLVGAQAIYLHTGEGELAVSPYTADADLAIDPTSLGNDPRLAEAMGRAGFVHAPEPDRIGTWIGREGVPVDLLVPDALSGPGKRAARLGVHGNRVAHRARGLEAALVDNGLMHISALEAHDKRIVEATVAGPTALLVAKLHKIADRQSSPKRVEEKDALDVYRLLAAISTPDLAKGIQKLVENELSRQVTELAVVELRAYFGNAASPGSQMAAHSVEAIVGPEGSATIAASCEALANDLLDLVQPD